MIVGNEFGNEETNGDINNRILCRYEYDAFGNTINAEETIANRYGFAGEMHDSITDMYYLRARYYAPYTGRFTQADTYHGDGLNPYIYAGNNTVKYVDPSGHSYKNNDAKSGKNSREIILPKESSHNAARNTLLKELDKTGAFKNGSNKYIGRLDSSYGYGKQIGRQSFDVKVR